MKHQNFSAATDASYSLRQIALPVFGPSLLFGVGEGAILPVVALTAMNMGATVSLAALIVALISLGSLFSNIPASIFTLHFGERWAIVAAGIWSALGMLLITLTSHLWIFSLGCVMIGMSQAIYHLARQSYITEVVPMAYRARALSTLGGTMRVGMFLGPFIGAAAMHVWGMQAAFFVGIVAVLSAAAVAAKVRELPALVAISSQSVIAKTSIASTLRDHRQVFLTLGIGVLMVTAVRSSRQLVIPLWADHLLLTPSVTSLIYGLSAAIDMLVFYPAGRVMDLKGRRWVAVPSMVIMGTALLLLPLTNGFTALLVVGMALGFGNGIGSGMIMTLGADHAPPHGRAHFLGIWRLAADMGSSIGPSLLAFLTTTLSLASAIASIGLIAYAASVVLFRKIPATKKI